MKGISRIDSRNTHGWFVRIFREGQVHSKMFSDRPHGGSELALQEARKYRDEYERQNPRKHGSLRIKNKPQRNNTTGVAGVSETTQKWRNGKVVPCFSVVWCPEPNVIRNKRFYHHHYDSREAALEAAAEFRKARELEILEKSEEAATTENEPLDPSKMMLAFLKSRPLK